MLFSVSNNTFNKFITVLHYPVYKNYVNILNFPFWKIVIFSVLNHRHDQIIICFLFSNFSAHMCFYLQNINHVDHFRTQLFRFACIFKLSYTQLCYHYILLWRPAKTLCWTLLFSSYFTFLTILICLNN